jgi:tetratricopeptide (TPR) repeat protein
VDEKATLSGGPDPEFLSWLDGLASVMTEFHQHETGAASEPTPPATGNLDEIEETLKLQFVQSEPDYPVYTKDQLAQTIEEDTASWYEPLPEFTGSHATPGPVMPTRNEPDELVQTAEEDAASWYEPLPEFTGSHSLPDPVMPAMEEPEKTARVEPASQTSAAIEEENAHLWNELGSIYVNTGAYDEAINAFKKAIELDLSYGWSYNNLAALYSRQGRYQDAIPLYQKGLQFLVEPRDKALLWNRLGDAYRRLNEQDHAAAAYRKAMELDPDNVSILTRARFSLLGNCRA